MASDRPVACRLYPLAALDVDGQETFGNDSAPPETTGVYGVKGTICKARLGDLGSRFLQIAVSYSHTFMRAEVSQSRWKP
jgi:hypothetical protein